MLHCRLSHRSADRSDEARTYPTYSAGPEGREDLRVLILHFDMGGHVPNVALLPRLDLTPHIPFPRPAPPLPHAVADEQISGLDPAVIRSVAAILKRTDMSFL